MPALVEALKDANENVRWRAAEALGRIGPAAKAAVPALEKLWQAPESKVRDATTEALKKIRGGRQSEESPKDRRVTPDAAPKTPAPATPEGVEEPGQDAS